jgi:cytochrome P450
MDPPEQRYYRQTLNPYLSPAAVAHWKPFTAEIVRAALNEKIETGQLDFVDDLANIVPAVLTLAMLGLPLVDWTIYCEPAHAGVYTKPDSPDMPRVRAQGFGDVPAAVCIVGRGPPDPAPGTDRGAGERDDQRPDATR